MATPRKRKRTPPPPPLVQAVTVELATLGIDLESVGALLALDLAADLSAPLQAGRATMTKELRAVMAELRASAAPSDGWDEAIAKLSTPST